MVPHPSQRRIRGWRITGQKKSFGAQANPSRGWTGPNPLDVQQDHRLCIGGAVNGGCGEILAEPENTQFLINAWRDGQDLARDKLVQRLLPELQQIAAARLRRERGSSISTGDLVNDAVLKIMAIDNIEVGNRGHLMALASRVMRNILIDHARARRRDKRQHEAVTLATNLIGNQSIDLIRLNTALVRLSAVEEELVSLVEMRFFGGMSLAEAGEVLGFSEATAKRRWFVARAWLADALEHQVDDD